jgi:alanine-synthesizing transaminase
LPWDPTENALAALARARAARGDLIDLTESNPTRVDVRYPTEAVARALAAANAISYAPNPLGLSDARAAIAAEYAREDTTVDPDRIVITASSSESYGFLFKLCCDPGDAVLVPEPSYPLFEYLARLEGVVPVPYRLAFDGVWHLDLPDLEQALTRARDAGTRPRVMIVVNPNNPTGSFLKSAEVDQLAEISERDELAVISDEVFSRYAFRPDPTRVATLAAAPALAARAPALFSLGGLSKSCGLPQLKLGWIVAAGRHAARSIAALEIVADTYLSVGTAVQTALPDLLALGPDVRGAIAARVAENSARLAASLPPASGCSVLPAEGGWSAILRVPATHSDEDWAGRLVAEAGVLVHPGYFFDLRGGTFLVLSLLPSPDRFAEGVRRLVAHVDQIA